MSQPEARRPYIVCIHCGNVFYSGIDAPGMDIEGNSETCPFCAKETPTPNRKAGDPVPEIPTHLALRYFEAKVHPEYKNVPSEIQTPKLKSVAESYCANIDRLHSLIDLPTALFYIASTAQYHADRAALDIFDKLNPTGMSPEQSEEWTDKAAEYMAHWRSTYNHADGLMRLGQARIPHMLGSFSMLLQPFEAILVGQITGTWTAFESMCGDLWEQALNAAPQRLACLSGSPRRIHRLAKGNHSGPIAGEDRRESDLEQGAKSGDTEKLVRLSDIQKLSKGTFDLSGVMGTVHRNGERFKFSVPEAIRAAYSSAFSKWSDEIDGILANRRIDAICLVRNVFVHQGGKADQRYCRDCKWAGAPEVESGHMLEINGNIVAGLIGPVLRGGIDLLHAVDEWIQKHGSAGL